ncbi:hypothetical protein BKA66DRAFT_41298 [Pyrenochaeta sp. MPI-SDFR-AT-0127]|nr:hypothetical protein BKA66DRAFT_41298 [Pyrenochaeta sp. MPI-SDFR-AT-0127]
MPQHRLEYYFSSRAPLIPSGCSFLDLPHSVRKLVYKYAELDKIFIDLNYSNLKVYANGTYPETQDCRKLDANGPYELKKLDVTELDEVWEIDDDAEDIQHYGTSVWGNVYGLHQSMLLTSKQIHREVEAFTYAGAVFRVCLGQPLGFARLWRMSDNALCNLGSLTIRLDTPKTVVWDDAWPRLPTPPACIDLSTACGRIVLKRWKLTLEGLVRSIRPGQLRLRVIFYAKTMGDATAIIEPMMQLPRLKDCGICAEICGQTCWWRPRVHTWQYEPPQERNKDTEISRFIENSIRSLTLVYHRDITPFRYLDLPQELRFAILEYTDLVSPFAVQWRPREWIVDSRSCLFDQRDGHRKMINKYEFPGSRQHYRGPNMEDIDRFSCCGQCSPEDNTNICYCSDYAPIRSSSCECHFSRRILFSVSRQVRQDALSVYYANNHILVTPYCSPKLRQAMCYGDLWPMNGIHYLQKIELSLYLSSVARYALQYIRRLEWILPRSKQTYLLPRTPAWFDYLDTILVMQHAMNIPALTFTINISHRPSYQAYPECMLSHEEARDWSETIILPMTRLGEAGLKDFFVHLRWNDIGEDTRVQYEQQLERAVMGKQYHSAERGKPEENLHKLLQSL